MNNQSKMYTFNIKDSNKYSSEEIYSFAVDMCADDAVFHGWAPGFTVELDDKTLMDQDSVIYTINVYGEYMEGDGPLDEEANTSFTKNSERFIAAPDLTGLNQSSF